MVSDYLDAHILRPHRHQTAHSLGSPECGLHASLPFCDFCDERSERAAGYFLFA
jgi:hypothetical protein